MAGHPISQHGQYCLCLTEQLGFIDIQISPQEIGKDTDIVVHLINIEEMENIIIEMADNIILMKRDHKDILQTEF